ncbi:hypothetical protein D3C84_1163510 [compost metagenome]
MHPGFQLHRVYDRKSQAFSEVPAQCCIKELTLDIAVMDDHHFAGHGLQKWLQYFRERGSIQNLSVGNVVKGD